MDPLQQVIGQSAGMVAIQAQVRRLLSVVGTGRRVPPILLRGETGTGKGFLARALHAASPRAKGRFVSVNCAAIPDSLLEAELFGFERGAFTDARQPKRGLFQEAHEGTLFLDEAGLLPESLQAKLLTALDEQAVRRLGGTRTEPTDCWIIAATSADLEQARRERRFREDLYHRLSVFTICLPPLRERGGDVLQMADVLLARVCADYGLPFRTLDETARRALARYDWPGNVRELGNVLERAALLAETSVISAEMLGLSGDDDRRDDRAAAAEDHRPSSDLRESLDDLERSKLLQALERAHWNVALAAEILGVPRNTLRYRLDKHGLTRPDAPVPRSRLRDRLGRHIDASANGAARDRRSARSERRAGSAPTDGVVNDPRRRAVCFLRVSVDGALPSASAVAQRLRLVAEKTKTFGGRVLRHADGEIDAAFGLEPTEDASARAGYAALAIRRLVEHAANEHPGPRLRIAIETLTCLVVETTRGEVRLAQESLEEAQRALGALIERTGTDVVVGPGAVPYLQRHFSLGTTGGLLDEPASTVLVRRDPADTASGRSSGPRRSPFVGRAHELSFLEQRLTQIVATGHGHVVGLMGEAGIGKSRLLAELRQVFAAQGVLILEGQCASHASTAPYSLLTDLLRRAWRLDDLDGTAAVADAVRGHLCALDLADCEPEIASLLGLPADSLRPLSPTAVKARIFDALRCVLLAHARSGPLVLFLEDLHWADQTSHEFVAVLVDSLPGALVLVVVTTRPGYRAAWLDRSWASQLALPPLSADGSREIIDALRPELDAASADAISRRAGGNPFFLEELVSIVGEGRATDVTIPATVRAVLDARIDRLPAGDKRLLQCAAVIGKDVPFRLLEAVADLESDELHRALGRLAAAELLLEARLFPEVELTFRHAVTHEVTYASLVTERRRALHARVLDVLAQTGPAYGERLSQLAHHAYRAGRWAEAVGFLRRVAGVALERSAAEEAATCLERALEALGQLPGSPERVTAEVDTRLELRNALFQLGRHPSVAEHLARAQALAEQIGDEGRLGWIHVYWAYHFGAEGDDVRSEAAALVALNSAASSGDRSLELKATFHLVQLYARTAQYARAVTLNRRLVDTADNGDPTGAEIGSAQLVIARLWLLWCLAELGAFDEGLRRADAMTRGAREPFERLTVRLGLGLLFLRQGRLAEAIATLEEALPLCRIGNLAAWFPAIASPLGYAYALSARVADGRSLLEQAVEATAQRGAVHALRIAHLAEAHLLAGEAEKARALATVALEAARTRGERAHEAYALRVLGRVATETSDSEAERHLRAAAELADTLEMRPLAAQSRLDLAVLYARVGMTEARDATAAETARLLEPIAMRDWLGRQG